MGFQGWQGQNFLIVVPAAARSILGTLFLQECRNALCGCQELACPAALCG